jgi:acetoacetate decarboxylase
VYSIRHLPPIVGKGGVTQLVKWYAETTYRRDERGEEVLFTGPTSLTYDSPSVIDPVHNLAIGQIMVGWYAEYETRLTLGEILAER